MSTTKDQIDDIMNTLIKHTDEGIHILSKPTEKLWSLPDLFIRQYLNNMADGFGMRSVYNMYKYLKSKKKTLIAHGMISKEGYNNSGFPLWKEYNFDHTRLDKLSEAEILETIDKISRRNAVLTRLQQHHS